MKENENRIITEVNGITPEEEKHFEKVMDMTEEEFLKKNPPKEHPKEKAEQLNKIAK